MKVVADIDIPFLKGVLEPYAEVVYLPGKDISKNDCADADALIVRTRTHCGRELLEGSRVSFVATATIGTDHLDAQWLSEAGIAWASAPGCNACGVMQYVHTALFTAASLKGIDLRDKTLGVVGAGNTGERVARLAEYLGFRVLRNDINMQLKATLVPLDILLEESDIVSFHLPLDSSTRGMISDSLLDRMRPGAVLVNACRGEVADDAAILRHRDRLSALIIDVWNDEPSSISKDLLDAADIATPHIAGYSYEGKVNGTAMAVQALARHFGIAGLLDFRPPAEPMPQTALPHFIGAPDEQARFARSLQNIFPIMDTDRALRSSPSSFERLRRTFPYRHEFSVPRYISHLL
ncbi:MAG TPA: 4-phosphoerythronate dehydrogenase [Candidatus Coprenecus stercoravium]|uniref:Erythronate-4-phosphate dehydrogenase n=1 Tax=Candidatus Coprenecus stercoravium TaxID=2840735 RepID=A0A9D2K983_9BACT|nr:4-phosphoerythronate dehydrogenase [Candidatus Coprenecus stercoravium]